MISEEISAEASWINILVLYHVFSIILCSIYKCHTEEEEVLLVIWKSHNLHLTPDTTEESDLSETLVDQTDSVDSIFHTSFILDNNNEAHQTPVPRNQGRKTNNDEEIKKLAFCLDEIKNKKIWFLSNKELLEKCFHNNLTPNGLKINLEPTIRNQNKEFVNQWYKIHDDCAKQLMNMTIKFCERTMKKQNMR